jgi:hypothetical protein
LFPSVNSDRTSPLAIPPFRASDPPVSHHPSPLKLPLFVSSRQYPMGFRAELEKIPGFLVKKQQLLAAGGHNAYS